MCFWLRAGNIIKSTVGKWNGYWKFRLCFFYLWQPFPPVRLKKSSGPWLFVLCAVFPQRKNSANFLISVTGLQGWYANRLNQLSSSLLFIFALILSRKIINMIRNQFACIKDCTIAWGGTGSIFINNWLHFSWWKQPGWTSNDLRDHKTSFEEFSSFERDFGT